MSFESSVLTFGTDYRDARGPRVWESAVCSTEHQPQLPSLGSQAAESESTSRRHHIAPNTPRLLHSAIFTHTQAESDLATEPESSSVTEGSTERRPTAQKFERGPAARPRAPPQNQNPVLSQNQPNTSSKPPPPPPQRAAPQPPQHRAGASPGESRAIRRIQGIRDHPLAAHSHGNSFSGSEATHRAAARRKPRITACSRLHSGATQPPIATAKGQSRRPGAHNWYFGDPAKEKK